MFTKRYQIRADLSIPTALLFTLCHDPSFLLVFGMPVEEIRVRPILNLRKPKRAFLKSFKHILDKFLVHLDLG